MTSRLLPWTKKNTLPKQDQLLTERICSKGSKFFPLRVDPIEKGDKRGRVTSPEYVPLSPNHFARKYVLGHM